MRGKLIAVAVISGFVMVSNQHGSYTAGAGEKVTSTGEAKPAPAGAPEAPAQTPPEKQSKPDDPLDKSISFDMNRATLDECCAFLSQASGHIKFSCSPELAKSEVVLKVDKMPLRTAIDWIARIVGGEPIYKKNSSGAVTEIEIVKAKAKPEEKPAPEAAEPPDEKTVKLLESKLAKDISFEFVDQPVEECIAHFRGLADASIISHPDCRDALKKTITLKAEKVSLGMALDTVLEKAGLQRTFKDGAIYITLKEAAAKPPEEKPAPPEKKPEVF